jgi:hypothetical protein
MLFNPAYSNDLTRDLTAPVTVALNRSALLGFFWSIITSTNAGRCFVIAILALGFFSSLGIVFVALPIGSIPIVGYILTFITGVGSFGALLVMLGIATPVVFTYYKKRDIWPLPSTITSGLKMITRCDIAIDFLKQINWSSLGLEKAGSNVKQIFDDLTSALQTRQHDEKKYGNAATKYAEKLLAMKELPKVLGAVIRALDATLRLRRQESFDFEAVKYFDLLLCTLQQLKDFVMGNLDDAIGSSPTPFVSGVTHAILKATDGRADDQNEEYKNASMRYLYSSIVEEVQESRQIGAAFSFPVNHECVMTDPDIADIDEKSKEKIYAWRADVEAHAAALQEELGKCEIDVSQDMALKLYAIYGTNDDVTVTLSPKIVGGIALPDEALQLLQQYPNFGQILGMRPEGDSRQIALHRGTAIPESGLSSDGNSAHWATMDIGAPSDKDIQTFFQNIPKDIKFSKNKKYCYVTTAWATLNAKFGTAELEVALPTISMVDSSDNAWITLAGMRNGSVVRTSEWVKYDPTNPGGTAIALCEMAIEKPLSAKQREEEEERRRNREQAKEFEALVEKHRKGGKPRVPGSRRP